MTRAISHGCKQHFNFFYRGPDCKTTERGRRRVSRLERPDILSLSFVKLSCHLRTNRTERERIEGELETRRVIRDQLNWIGRYTRGTQLSDRTERLVYPESTEILAVCRVVLESDVTCNLNIWLFDARGISASAPARSKARRSAQTAVFYAFCAFKREFRRREKSFVPSRGRRRSCRGEIRGWRKRGCVPRESSEDTGSRREDECADSILPARRPDRTWEEKVRVSGKLAKSVGDSADVSSSLSSLSTEAICTIAFVRSPRDKRDKTTSGTFFSIIYFAFPSRLCKKADGDKCVRRVKIQDIKNV